MADPNQKNDPSQKNDQRSQQPSQDAQRAAQQPPAEQRQQPEKREYTVKHKIVQGGSDARRVLTAGSALRLTDDEARKLGDAVELRR